MRLSPRTLAFQSLGLALAIGIAACVQEPTAADRTRLDLQLERLARAPARTHIAVDRDIARLTHQPLVTNDPPASAVKLTALLSRPPAIAAQAAFDLGVSGAPNAAELIEANLPADAPAEVVAAAAAGLATSKSDATERVLLGLALRPSHPAEALDSLFVHYRSRDAARPLPATLLDARLLMFANDSSPRKRMAFCELARAIKDPALVGTLAGLTTADADFEVRRAAIQALAEGTAARKRTDEVRDSCLAIIADRFRDPDTHVVIAACRAAASYDDARSVALLTTALSNADFNVRVAAIEGLGLRKAKSAAVTLTQLARSDPSASVRYAAAVQLTAIDAAAALPLAEVLLADASAFVRTAGVAVLAKATDPHRAYAARATRPVRSTRPGARSGSGGIRRQDRYHRARSDPPRAHGC